MLMFAVTCITEPLEGNVCDELSAPDAVNVTSIAATASAAIRPKDSFLIVMSRPH